MAESKKIQESISINNGFDLLTRSYQEHAIGQINLARYSVLYSRGFAEDLSEIFSNVKKSYFKSLAADNLKSSVKNGKELWILITANNKLYGDIIIRTCQFFMRHLKLAKQSKVDLVVIGNQGKRYLDESKINWPYQFIDVPDSNSNSEFLKELIMKLGLYENIYVFYGKYNNLVSQMPVQAALSGDLNIESETNNNTQNNKQKYLFEPDIKEVVKFFENQILTLLLNQTVQEAQLARFASRINAMESAQTNIHKQLEILKKQEKMLKIKNMNKKQTELLSGRKLWNKK